MFQKHNFDFDKTKFIKVGDVNIFISTINKIVLESLNNYSSFKLLNNNTVIKTDVTKFKIELDIKIVEKDIAIKALVDMLERDIEKKVLFFTSIEPEYITIKIN